MRTAISVASFERIPLQIPSCVSRVRVWVSAGGLTGVQRGVKPGRASARQDKSPHMLWLGVHFTPLLMNTIIHKQLHGKNERRRKGRLEKGKIKKKKNKGKKKEKSKMTRGRKGGKKSGPYLFHLLCSFSSTLIAFPWGVRTYPATTHSRLRRRFTATVLARHCEAY